MTNLDIIKKLTLGKEDTTKVKIDYCGEEVEFELRPLTDGELTRLQSIEKKPLIVRVGMQNGRRQSTNISDVDVNTGEFTEAQAEAMYTAISLSLSIDEEIPVEDIKNMPTGLPQLLYDKVIEISKLSDNDLTSIKTFRKTE